MPNIDRLWAIVLRSSLTVGISPHPAQLNQPRTYVVAATVAGDALIDPDSGRPTLEFVAPAATVTASATPTPMLTLASRPERTPHFSPGRQPAGGRTVMSDQLQTRLQTTGIELPTMHHELQIDDDKLRAMDARADDVIRNWSMGALGANLLPPPFDMVAVGGVFAGMGARLASIYEVEIDRTTLKHLGVAVAKGVGAVVAAGYFGTNLLKFVPGVNVGIALLIQPPIVAAVAHSAGHAFKQYFHVLITEGRDLTPEQVRALAESALRSRLSGRVSTWLQRVT